MSWTRHLYDPVGAIARDTGILGGRRRVMTPEEIAQSRGGGGQSARDPSRVGGAYSNSRQQRPESSYERLEAVEPAATPMAKPMPVLADPGKGPASAPVTTGATARYTGPGGGGVAVIPAANSGLQVGPEGGGLAPSRPQRAPIGPLPGQPGNPHTGRHQITPEQARYVEQMMTRFRADRPPVMSAPPATPPPTAGRFARRPFP